MYCNVSHNVIMYGFQYNKYFTIKWSLSANICDSTWGKRDHFGKKNEK